MKISERERRILAGQEHLTVSQWAERHRIVTTGHAQGLWKNETTPYLVEPMDTWNAPWVRHIILCFAPQIGKTSVALNCLLYSLDQDPGPAMYLMPDEKVAKRIAARQILPIFRASPRIRRLLSDRVSDTSTLSVKFTNGADLMMAWASSPAVLASESVRYLFRDEPAKYPDFTGKEADPFSLSEVRLNSYKNISKIIDFSTPNLDGDAFDLIFQNEPDETRVYQARCPFCQKYQVMTDERIHAGGVRDPGSIRRRKLARYTCEHCGMDWDDWRRDQAVKAGRWEPIEKVDRPRCVAFGPLPSWYSPFVSLSSVLAAFFQSKEDPAKFMAYVTQHKAEAWCDRVEVKEQTDILKHRSEYPPDIVPPGVVALTAGIDVQQIGFWFVVRGWEKDLTSHLISYGFLNNFEDVEWLIFQNRYKQHDSDENMGIWRAAMDIGGGPALGGQWSRTEEIKEWLRKWAGLNIVHGVKGASRPQLKKVMARPLDSAQNRAGRIVSGGLLLRTLDTGQFKDLLHWRLTRVDGESQRFYLHSETDAEYAQQFLAEEKRRDRRRQLSWVQIRRDNHLLDCEVYAAACADSEWQPSLTNFAHQLEIRKTAPPPNVPEASGGGWIRGTRSGGWL
jgi:phage terminase large subunit GpA-like protein